MHYFLLAHLRCSQYFQWYPAPPLKFTVNLMAPSTQSHPISSVARVRMGVTLRGRDATRHVPDGSTRVIRISEISDSGTLDSANVLRINIADSLNSDLFLQSGDILFPNRGHRTTAHVFRQSDEKVIVGAQFFVLRPNIEAALPEYVGWYLRTEAASRHFQALRKGTLVQTVQRGDVESLLIPLPSLHRQRIVVEVDALAAKEREFSSRLTMMRSALAETSLLTALSNS